MMQGDRSPVTDKVQVAKAGAGDAGALPVVKPAYTSQLETDDPEVSKVDTRMKDWQRLDSGLYCTAVQ